jgi:enoyl-CoA hydratase
MVPGWSGTQRLVTRFGANVIRQLALTGEIVTAARALDMGLINEVVPKGTALERARAMAEQIRLKSPVATTLTKQLINAAEGDDVAATLEILAGALITTTADRREGVAAFLAKRPANFEDLDR